MRLRSAVCSSEAIVVRAPVVAGDISCGGHPMVPLDADPPTGAVPAPDALDGTLLGKRYVDEVSGLELLCTKPGRGSLAYNSVKLAVKENKPLPSSD
jgi:hypothetical protein